MFRMFGSWLRWAFVATALTALPVFSGPSAAEGKKRIHPPETNEILATTNMFLAGCLNSQLNAGSARRYFENKGFKEGERSGILKNGPFSAGAFVGRKGKKFICFTAGQIENYRTFISSITILMRKTFSADLKVILMKGRPTWVVRNDEQRIVLVTVDHSVKDKTAPAVTMVKMIVTDS